AADLAQLDEEQRRLDDEMLERGNVAPVGPTRSLDPPPWTDHLADIVTDVTERIGSLAGGWPFRANDTIDASVDVSGALPVVIESRGGSIKVRRGAPGSVKVTGELFAPTKSLLDEMLVTAEND